MSLLELSGVVAGYGKGPDILKGVDLTVDEGDVKCIIGPNGAGKSTLLKAIGGMLPLRSGDIRLRGEPIHKLRPDQILAKGVCFVPQERSLFPDMSVYENLRMGGYIINDRAETDRRIKDVFEVFPILNEKRGQSAKTLSGGQQQMLVMGRTMVLSPAVVMLDEPSLGLAPLIVEQVFEMIALFKTRGMTVLLVEQNARKGLEAADTGCVLDLGRNHFEAPADKVLDDPRIQALYLGSRKEKKSA